MNIELIHGYLAILIVCYTMSYASLSYITLFSLVLSLNIGLVCYSGLLNALCLSNMMVGVGGGG